jgi:hypothetical protein
VAKEVQRKAPPKNRKPPIAGFRRRIYFYQR